MNIRTDLIVRVCIFTAIFSLLSYFLVQRSENMDAYPLLFLLFGVVTIISIVYDFQRFGILKSEQNTKKMP